MMGTHSCLLPLTAAWAQTVLKARQESVSRKAKKNNLMYYE